LVAFSATVLFAQAGPKREEKKKSKPDTTAVEKPEKAEKPEKPEKPEKAEKPAKPEKVEEPAKSEKQEKPEKAEKPEKREKVEKPAKPETPEKPEKPESPPPAKSTVPEKAMATTKSEHIARAVVASAIERREPVGKVDSLSAPADSVYFFTEIVGMEGQTVTHRWMRDGEVVAEVPIAVGAPHWRAYSKKRLIPAWAGRWTVEAVDPDGNVLASRSFVYTTGQP